jgi:hypothetical protein
MPHRTDGMRKYLVGERLNWSGKSSRQLDATICTRVLLERLPPLTRPVCTGGDQSELFVF